LVIAAALAFSFSDGSAQTASSPPARKYSIRVKGGVTWVLSRPSLTTYWNFGPAGSFEIAGNINRHLSLGLGVDVSAYWFRAGMFSTRYPGVPLENKPVAHLTVGMVARYELFPGRQLGSFVGLSVGASRLTEAVYQRVIDSVRVTYFSIPGRMRLAVGLHAGTDFMINRWIAIEGEARLLFVHNDPDIGAAFTVRTGVKYLF
jgi:hypothetical protein